MKLANDSLFARMQISPNVPQQRRLFSLPVDEFAIKVSFSDTVCLRLFPYH